MSIIAKPPAINFSGQHKNWKQLLPVYALSGKENFRFRLEPPQYRLTQNRCTSSPVQRFFILTTRQTHPLTLSRPLRSVTVIAPLAVAAALDSAALIKVNAAEAIPV
jgi:hypothetical protein